MTVRVRHSGTTLASGAPYVTAWTGVDGMRRLDLSPYILSIGVENTVNSPVGNFSLEILPMDLSNSGELNLRTNVQQLSQMFLALAANTPIEIGVDTPGGIMLGLVESCDYTDIAINNRIHAGLHVTGTSLGHVLNDHIIQASVAAQTGSRWKQDIADVLGADAPELVELKGAEGPVNAITQERSLFGVTIDAIATYAMSRIKGTKIPMLRELGGTGTVADFTQVQASSFEDDQVWKKSLYLQETTALGFLQEILDMDFYELRMETMPREGKVAQPVLIIRPKPFDEQAFTGAAWPPFSLSENASWENARTFVEGLPYHDITPDDASGQFRLGRTRNEVTSYLTVVNNNELGVSQESVARGLAQPIRDLYNASKYITARRDVRVSLLPADPNDRENAEKIRSSVQSRRNRIFAWDRAQPEFLSGSIKVHGRDVYRAGDVVRLGWIPDPLSGQAGVRFYCTAVQHSWSYGGPGAGEYSCTLSLTRGHGPGFWEAYLEKVKASMPTSVPYGWTAI